MILCHLIGIHTRHGIEPRSGHEVAATAFAPPNLRVVLLFRQRTARTADGDVDGATWKARPALAGARRR